jgi:hypothetical protein
MTLMSSISIAVARQATMIVGVAPSTAAGVVEAASAALAPGPFVGISGAISHGMIAHFGA